METVFYKTTVTIEVDVEHQNPSFDAAADIVARQFCNTTGKLYSAFQAIRLVGARRPEPPTSGLPVLR